jgi:hypothetical protein
MVFSTNGARTISHPRAKLTQANFRLFIKINSKWIINLNVKQKAMKLLKQNIGDLRFEVTL